MRILQICKKLPWPLHDGESIAVYGMAQGLKAQGYELHLLAVNTSKHHRESIERPTDQNPYSSTHVISVDNSLTLSLLLNNFFFSDTPIHVDRLLNEEFREKLIQILKTNEYDIVLIETVFAALYIREIKIHSSAKIVIRSHNAEYMIWERLNRYLSYWKKPYYSLQTKRIRNFEMAVLNQADLVLPLSEPDLEALRSLGVKSKAQTVPIGLDLSNYKPRRQSEDFDKVRLCFIGTLDWAPNLQGLQWFLDEVWPLIKNSEIRARLELHIAGKNMPKSIQKIKKTGIHIHGEVNDAISFIQDHDAMIVPLFAGSGQRVKILQAMAAGLTVLSTTVGIEGIDVKNEEEFYRCDNEMDFYKRIKGLILNKELLSPEKVNQVVQAKYDYIKLSKRSHAALSSILK